MDGMNREFIADPPRFLRRRAIALAFEARENGAPPQGLVTFDLRPDARDANYVFMDVMADRDKDPTWKTKSIRAHWLPWQGGATTSIQLDGRANYFFTSQIAGCRIVVIPGPARRVGTNHPRVMHIAGDGRQNDQDVNGNAWRTAQMNANTTVAERGRARALSSTGNVLTPLGYQGECVNVVGFISYMKWRFWAQQFDTDADPPVTRCWQIA